MLLPRTSRNLLLRKNKSVVSALFCMHHQKKDTGKKSAFVDMKAGYVQGCSVNKGTGRLHKPSEHCPMCLALKILEDQNNIIDV